MDETPVLDRKKRKAGKTSVTFFSNFPYHFLISVGLPLN